MGFFYNIDGEPLTEWQDISEALGNRWQIVDEIDGWTVSTVFLTINHNFHEGPPMLFETMIFDAEGSSVSSNRYATKEEAEAGHKKIVEEWL